LDFEDKYRLWADFIRGKPERMFISTEQTFRIGAQILVEVALKTLPLPIVVFGTVAGQRVKSERFAAGVYLSFPQKEVDKVRRFIGLGQPPDLAARTRHEARVDVDVPIQLRLAEGTQEAVAKNISQSGIKVATAARLFESERVELVLKLGQVEASFLAEVVWANEAQQLVGFHLLDASGESWSALSGFIETRRVQEKRAEAEINRMVFVADDDPAVLQLLNTELTKHGYQVQQASRGDEALDLIRKVRPSFVMLDVLMPGIDGADICKMMRADPGLAEVPVVFLSALDAAKLEEVAAESGATDFLSKPVDLARLLNVVGTYLKA
jgi:CheY-like chemotaxis protein/Tfp pilus assembly protein PilZ